MIYCRGTLSAKNSCRCLQFAHVVATFQEKIMTSKSNAASFACPFHFIIAYAPTLGSQQGREHAMRFLERHDTYSNSCICSSRKLNVRVNDRGVFPSLVELEKNRSDDAKKSWRHQRSLAVGRPHNKAEDNLMNGFIRAIRTLLLFVYSPWEG
jgi:hypothetical protein